MNDIISKACLLLAIYIACCYCGSVPSWEPTYDMQMSTIFMPCNTSGFFDAKFAAQFGIADFDWSNAKNLWVNGKPMTCEELLVEQAARVKAINPKTKVFVYRNLVKALPWYTNVNSKISNKAYEGWFLKFSGKNNYHVPQCDNNYNPPLCTEFYHDQEQSPHHPHGEGSCIDPCDCGGVPCGEYLWDHRNTTLTDYLVNHVILGKTALGNEHISGLFLDDRWTDSPSINTRHQCDNFKYGGATEEDYYCVLDMGLDQKDLTDIYTNWQSNVAKVYEAIASNNGWSWQQFSHFSTPTKEKCAATFRAECSSDSHVYTNAIYYLFTLMPNRNVSYLPQLEEDMAGFLLVRGPYAWLGYGWQGCSTGSEPPGAAGNPYAFPDELKLDYGTPMEVCHETEKDSGIFVRKWSKATVQFDCNTYKGSVKFVN